MELGLVAYQIFQTSSAFTSSVKNYGETSPIKCYFSQTILLFQAISRFSTFYLQKWQKVKYRIWFQARRFSIEPNSYGDMAGWLGGWLAVCHSRYCIKTTKPIGELFGPSGKAHHLSIQDPLRRYQIPWGTPSTGALNTRGGGGIGDFRSIFDVHRRLSRKRCEIGRWLPQNVNRKSWVPDWMG